MIARAKCELAIGIDFGTTFTAVTIYINGNPIAVALPGEGTQIPTAIAYTDDGQIFIGKKALRYGARYPNRCFSLFKRGVLDAPHKPWQGGPTSFQLCADFLRELWKLLLIVVPDIQSYLPDRGGKRPRAACRLFIANPSNCGIEQRRTYQQFAAEVGLGFCLDGQADEPIAASFQYRLQYADRIQHRDLIAVFDIGGGTFDITVLRSNHGILDTVVGARGDSKLGGRDFTDRLIAEICKRVGFRAMHMLEESKGFNFAAKGITDAQRIAAVAIGEHAEDAKQQLSTFDHATIYVEGGKANLQEVKISREEFLALTETLYQRFDQAASEALSESGIEWQEVSHVLLVGGSGLLPTLRERLAKVVGRETTDIYCSNDSAQLVASGTAYQAWALEETARHSSQGIGGRFLLEKNGTTSRNRLWFAPREVISADGAIVESLGQFVNSSGGSISIGLTIVEAKPGVTVSSAGSGATFLEDEQTMVVDEVVFRFDLPPGEHEARVVCGINPGNQVQLTVSFPNLPNVEPQTVRIGQAATQLVESAPLRVALLIDVSGSMERDKLPQAKLAIAATADIVLPQGGQIGLISFGDTAKRHTSFTDDSSVVSGALEQLVAGGGTPMAEALLLARSDFKKCDAGIRKVAVLATDGAPNSPCDARRTAEKLKADGTQLICVGIGADADKHFLQGLASSPDLYFYAKLPAELPGLFSKISRLYLSSKEPTHEPAIA